MQGRGGGRGRGPGGFFDDRGPPGGGWNGREGGGGFPQDGPGFGGRGPEGGYMDMHGQDRGPFMQGDRRPGMGINMGPPGGMQGGHMPHDMGMGEGMFDNQMGRGNAFMGGGGLGGPMMGPPSGPQRGPNMGTGGPGPPHGQGGPGGFYPGGGNSMYEGPMGPNGPNGPGMRQMPGFPPLGPHPHNNNSNKRPHPDSMDDREPGITGTIMGPNGPIRPSHTPQQQQQQQQLPNRPQNGMDRGMDRPPGGGMGGINAPPFHPNGAPHPPGGRAQMPPQPPQMPGMMMQQQQQPLMPMLFMQPQLQQQLQQQQAQQQAQQQQQQQPPGPANDYSQNFVDTGQRSQNYVQGAHLSERHEEYPKMQELIARKDKLVHDQSTLPTFLKADLRSLKLSTETFGTKFDTILVDPPWEEYVRRAPGMLKDPEVWAWDDIMALEIEAIAENPSVLFLWCGSGEEGLDAGRHCLKKWGFRRSEDICWIKTNSDLSRRKYLSAVNQPHSSMLVHTKEHCLMGIKGNIRRNTDAHVIHANCDTDVIVSEEPDLGSCEKPEEMYQLIEHFALGKRRLELFGEDHNIREGWVTVGKSLTHSNFNAPSYASHFRNPNGSLWVGNPFGNRIPLGAPILLPISDEIEELRPKSPINERHGRN
ncbi:MAG: hypothetical protein WDW36_009373 [Sanguina aurantia]